MAKTPGGQAGEEAEVTDLAFDLGRPPPPLAEKAGDLDALRTAVVDAASVSGALWLSYLFVLFYFLVAAGGVTHRDLFLENPVKLPFLNVDLPLKGFFWLGPLIFLIVHTYVLLHFVVLAGKVRAFDAALIEQVPWFEPRASLRRQLPTNIFVQFLAGPREVRLGFLGGLLWGVAVISLVVGPVAVLLFFELQFLPYHEEWITWVQRVAVAAELVLLWNLWPLIASRSVDTESGQAFGWRRPRWFTAGPMRFVLGAVCVLLAAGVPAVTTFPGETIDPLIPRTLTPWPGMTLPVPILTWAREALVEGVVNPASRRPVSLFSNRLVLPGLDVIDHAKLDSDAKFAAVQETVSLRYRHLEGAVLIDAGLRRADFTAALLQNALLAGADLRGAKFGCAPWPERSTRFREPICTHLEGASLIGASLQGASLDRAWLQGASLGGASLQGASLDRAWLQGASLGGASLQGASLVQASLQGASLVVASLQGASLNGAWLQGASLGGASLQGASLDEASLQGASLDWAHLQGASLTGSFVWRTDVRHAIFDNTDISNIDTAPRAFCSDMEQTKVCDWNVKSFLDLRAAIEKTVPEGDFRGAALSRIDPALDPSQPFAAEQAIDAKWQALRDHPATPEMIAEERVRQLKIAGCDPGGAPYVVTGLARRRPFEVFVNHVPQPVAAAFLDPACEGARGISAETTATLKYFAQPAPATPHSQ